jgi:hypothetical protein
MGGLTRIVIDGTGTQKGSSARCSVIAGGFTSAATVLYPDVRSGNPRKLSAHCRLVLR